MGMEMTFVKEKKGTTANSKQHEGKDYFDFAALASLVPSL